MMVTQKHCYPANPTSHTHAGHDQKAKKEYRGGRGGGRGRGRGGRFKPGNPDCYISRRPGWGRRNQQHPFIPGGEYFSVRRSRARRFNPHGLSPRGNSRGSKWGRRNGSNPSFYPGKWPVGGGKVHVGFAGGNGKKQMDNGARGLQNQQCLASRFYCTPSGSPWKEPPPYRTDVQMTGCGKDGGMPGMSVEGNRREAGEKDSLMYSLEGRSCPPAPRHEPQYLLEGVCSFRDWGASPSIRSGMSTVHACPSTKPNPLFEQENALRRIDQQLEDFRANITSPMQDVPCRVRQKLEHQNTVITSLEEDNYILRRMVMDLQAKLLTNGTVQSPLSSVADNSPLDEYSYL